MEPPQPQPLPIREPGERHTPHYDLRPAPMPEHVRRAVLGLVATELECHSPECLIAGADGPYCDEGRSCSPNPPPDIRQGGG